MNGFLLLAVFFALMLFGVPLYASLTMAGLLGILGAGGPRCCASFRSSFSAAWIPSR